MTSLCHWYKKSENVPNEGVNFKMKNSTKHSNCWKKDFILEMLDVGCMRKISSSILHLKIYRTSGSNIQHPTSMFNVGCWIHLRQPLFLDWYYSFNSHPELAIKLNYNQYGKHSKENTWQIQLKQISSGYYELSKSNITSAFSDIWIIYGNFSIYRFYKQEFRGKTFT